MNDVETSYRIIAFKGGGFILVDTSGAEPHIVKAMSTMDELVVALGRSVQDWHAETIRVAKAQEIDADTDQPKVIKPPRFWWRKAVTR